MDFLTGLKISSSALKAQRTKNGGNILKYCQCSNNKNCGGWSLPTKRGSFGAEAAKKDFGEILEGELEQYGQKVHATEVISSNRPPILKYEPNHPDANEQGYVAYPDINVMKETADMISASRHYEANVNAFNTTKSMAIKGLEIGR